MHVLVTGGAGFIGSHLVEFHLNQGDSVLAVDDLSTGSIENIKPFLENNNFRFEEADILTWPEIEKAVCWADRVYHMAAVVGMFKVLKEPIKTLAVNIAGSERILRAAQACTEDRLSQPSRRPARKYTRHLATSMRSKRYRSSTPRGARRLSRRVSILPMKLRYWRSAIA